MNDHSTKERFVGVDFHKENTVVTRLYKDGARACKTQIYPSTRAGLAEFRESRAAQDHVVVEATYHFGHCLRTCLRILKASWSWPIH
jgi:hypothetical protein